MKGDDANLHGSAVGTRVSGSRLADYAAARS